MEDSPIGLDKWLPVMWLVANCRNGVSSREIHRDLGVTQKSAWFMLGRVRLAMQDNLTGGKLGGPMGPVVEVDETFIGGKARNMHADRKARVMKGKRGGSPHKTVVLGILERASADKQKRVRARVASNVTQPEIRDHVLENVHFGTQINSDEAGERWGMPQHYMHEMVNHAERYVDGNVHTNGIENFWSLLKRGIGGTYVSVEPFHLFRYIDEQAFRFNNRLHADGDVVTDAERFGRLCDQVLGKRLTYAQLTGKQVQERPEDF